MQYMLFAYQTGSFDWMFQSAGSAAPVVVDGANGSGGATDTGKGMLWLIYSTSIYILQYFTYVWWYMIHRRGGGW